MFTVEQEIEIDSPPDEVFGFLDEPRNHVKITPGLIDVTNVEPLPNGGKRARYRYKLAGVELTGHVEDVDRKPGVLLVQELSGAIDGTITYDFTEPDSSTRLSYVAEYSLPDTVIDTVLEPIAEAYNRREAETTLANLKTHVEARR
jgi:carbon monoxide dehydrogenase subunit G